MAFSARRLRQTSLARLFGRGRRPAPGSMPGTVVVDESAEPTALRWVRYDAHAFVEHQDESHSVDELPLNDGGGVVWIDASGLANTRLLEELASRAGIHPLVLEDIVHTGQRAKTDEYDEGRFLVCRMLRPDSEGIETEQLGIWLGGQSVITFQERVGDVFEPVRARIRTGRGRIRRYGPDYLVYALLDACVDAYFPVLETYGEALEELEEQVLERVHQSQVVEILRMKRELTQLRRSCWPMREMVQSLIRSDDGSFEEMTKVYLRDVHDHVVQVLDMIEGYREIVASLLDLYLSTLSHGMNETMRVLTVISTIFIPMMFLTGLYGMNFDTKLPGNMPELETPYAYVGFLVVLGIIALLMLLWFRRLGWLGGKRDLP